MARIAPPLIIIAGGALVAAGANFAAQIRGPAFIAQLSNEADAIIAELGADPVEARFADRFGAPSRHVLLSGGEGLTEQLRADVATRVGAIDGVGGVHWSDGTMLAQPEEQPLRPPGCQDDVRGLLRARTLRFEESSATVDPSSEMLLDEVAEALRPCLGAQVAIVGHTDSSGPEPENLALSRERAAAVRSELIERGIPGEILKASGEGSAKPIDGLEPGDPANRRIEFTVLSVAPLVPTPVDKPGPR